MKEKIEKDYIVWAEIEASKLLTGKVAGFGNSTNARSPHEAGNYIIQLAEKIKAERAVITMIK
jgi:hypothetical protein